MLVLYVICFWVGLILIIATALFGGHGGMFHIHLDGGGHFPFSLNALLGFLTVFGGVGYILKETSPINGAAILMIASAAGLLIAWILFLFLSKVLMRTEHIMQESDYSLTGTLGRVSVAIPENGAGEIKYVLRGTTRSAGAREEYGKQLPRGTKVFILKIEKGMAIVSVFEE